MYRRRAPTAWYAFTLAMVGGVLLATGRWLAGAICVVLALICIASDYFETGNSSGSY